MEVKQDIPVGPGFDLTVTLQARVTDVASAVNILENAMAALRKALMDAALAASKEGQETALPPREGWLEKAGIFNSSYKRRFIRVIPGQDMLDYYESPSDKEPKGQINLRNASIIEAKDGFCWRIVQFGDARGYEFRAQSREEAQSWIAYLKAVSVRFKTQRASAPSSRTTSSSTAS